MLHSGGKLNNTAVEAKLSDRNNLNVQQDFECTWAEHFCNNPGLDYPADGSKFSSFSWRSTGAGKAGGKARYASGRGL